MFRGRYKDRLQETGMKGGSENRMNGMGGKMGGEERMAVCVLLYLDTNLAVLGESRWLAILLGRSWQVASSSSILIVG